ncbi:MAG TPA: hypothetical protein VF466_00835 [Candidatus Saccharimonadales bacterium]
MRARYIKIIIWVLALCVVVELGQTYTVTNSLFVFAAAGVIPGTNITLNPDQVMSLLVAVLALAVVFIFGTNIVRGFRAVAALLRRQKADLEPAVAAAEDEVISADSEAMIDAAPMPMPLDAVEPEPQPIVVVRRPRRPSRVLLLLHVLGSLLGMGFAAAVSAARAHTPRLAAVISSVARGIAAVAGAMWQRLRAVAGRVAHELRWALIRAAIVVCRTAIGGWRRAEPYLRRFDAWLGVQYHRILAAIRRNETYKLAANLVREAGRVVTNVRDEARSRFTRFAQK